MIQKIKTAVLLLIFAGLSQAGKAQDNVALSGTVMDAATRKPVEGASVITDDSLSTFTDSEGVFRLEKGGSATLITVLADGYARQIIPVKGRTDIKVRLYEENYETFQSEVNLDYVSKPHLYVTQAVEKAVFENDNYKTPGESAEYLFNNSFSGLSVTRRSGMVANGSVMNIRGYNSLNCSSRPLIVVDGMISDFTSNGIELLSGAAYNSFAGISIDDIESVTVLKDGTSIYGAQGGNGVIYIETIKAAEAATKIQFSTYRGVRYSPERIPVLNSYAYRSYLSEILYSQGLTADSIATLPYMIDDPSYLEYNTYHNETNWQDEIYQDGIIENYSLKIKGGDNIALYGLSLGYMGSQGTLGKDFISGEEFIRKNTGFERYSIRFNSDINVSTRVKVTANISWASGIRNLMDDGDSPVTNPVHLALSKAPFLYYHTISPTGDISSRFEDADVLGVSNPVALLRYAMAQERNNASAASILVNFKATNRFNFSNRLGITYFKTRFNTFTPHTGVADYVSDLGVIENTIQNKVESKYMVYNDTRASYEMYRLKNHSLYLVAGMRLMMNQTQEHWGIAHNSPNDELRSIGQGVDLYNEIGGYIGDWNTMTWYGQVDYDFMKKYFATVGLSLDGSSRFGEEASGIPMFNSRFGVFPSVTAAWLLSSEEFMHNLDIVDFAKIRLGYTKAGNGDIGNYSSQKYYVSQNLMGAFGLISGNLYNPALQWENNDMMTLGLDIGLFNDRITLTADLFSNTSSNLLTLVNPEYFVGYDSYLTNFGSLTTSGLDISFNARIINRAVKWDLGINLLKAQTIVNEYFGDEEVVDVYGGQVLIREGEPLGQFYGYKRAEAQVFADDAAALAANLYQEMPNTDLVPFQAGDVHFAENPDYVDGKINENDRQVIGDPNPDLLGSISTRLSWKGLTVEATVAFSYGNDVYNYLRRQMESLDGYGNQTEVALNRWQVQGQVTDIPRAVYGDPIGNARFSDRWIEDGSYLRLQNVTVSYRLPLSKLINQTIDIFATGQNLITLTNYLGLDPEFAIGNSPLVRGVDVGLTPQTRAVFAGIRIGL